MIKVNVVLTNKLVIELNEAREKMGNSWAEMCSWLQVISRKICDLDCKSFRMAVERLIEKKRKLSRHSGNNFADTNEFLAKEFFLPEKRCSEPDQIQLYQAALDERATEIEKLINFMEESNNKIELLSQIAQEQSAAGSLKQKEISDMREKLWKMREEYEGMSHKLENAMEKLGKVSIRNFNKKLRRRDEMNLKLTEKSKQQEEEIELLQEVRDRDAEMYEGIIDEKNEIIIRLNDKLDSALKAKTKAQRLKRYYKDKARTIKEKGGNSHLSSKISELKSRIADLENDVELLQEQIDEFLETPAVKTFHNGKYTDEIRAVYEDLLCWGVGVNNVGNVVRTVVEKLVGLECERLPKATFARYMHILRS